MSIEPSTYPPGTLYDALEDPQSELQWPWTPLQVTGRCGATSLREQPFVMLEILVDITHETRLESYVWTTRSSWPSSVTSKFYGIVAGWIAAGSLGW
jgi:hypothetical protein